MKLQNITPQARKEFQSQSLNEKMGLGKEVLRVGFNKFGVENTAVAWTGGKDSTLILWLVKQVCQEDGHELPKVMFVDEGDVFDEVWGFVDELVEKWELDFSVAHNEDVSSKVEKLGGNIKVSDLNETNRQEVQRIGYKEGTFPYEPESFVGNHLMKTVATNIWVKEHGVKTIITGVRWDEQGARGGDDFLREMPNSPQDYNIEPILQFLEKDVWEAIHENNIPYVKLYEEGYRSLGARVTTQRAANKPAWEQDLENTTEREGRRQDKEKIMGRLRDLGYM